MMASRGIAVPDGFEVASATAGLKPSGKPDMALVVNRGPRADAAALFTRNQVVAAPVTLSRAVVADGRVRAVITNAGNANACTGPQGLKDALETQARVAAGLGLPPTDVAVCSTGIIGEPLDMAAMRGGVDALLCSLGVDDEAAAQAIMTTDTVPKQAVASRDGWSVGAMGKGVGMLAPSLATMLVTITTDAIADPQVLHRCLARAAATTFDTLDIDGCTSTNDTVLAMASGASGRAPGEEELAGAITDAAASIAEQMQADAEGVTKRVTIEVVGAAHDDDARAAARTVARDTLVKCAMFGSDPNWGRVLAAVGMAPVEMNPKRICVWFNGVAVCRDSTGTPGAREVDLSGSDIAVRIDLGTDGPGRGLVRTTDLSHAYVELNSAYTT